MHINTTIEMSYNNGYNQKEHYKQSVGLQNFSIEHIS